MVNSISSSDENMQSLMIKMFQKIGAADTDGINGLSKNELSSINAGNDKRAAAFLKSLNEQFDALDTNENGQISSEEFASAKPPCASGQMGPPPGMSISSIKDSSETLTGSVNSTQNSSSSASSEPSASDLIASLLEKLLESFTKSYDKNNDSKGSHSNKINSLLATSDTDKSGGVSLDELKSVDTSNNKNKAGFVNDLITNFNKYDADGDGNLSKSELLAAMPKQFSQQEIAEMFKKGNSSSSVQNPALNIQTFMGKMVSAYQNSGGLSSLASSLSIAG